RELDGRVVRVARDENGAAVDLAVHELHLAALDRRRELALLESLAVGRPAVGEDEDAVLVAVLIERLRAEPLTRDGPDDGDDEQRTDEPRNAEPIAAPARAGAATGRMARPAQSTAATASSGRSSRRRHS